MSGGVETSLQRFMAQATAATSYKKPPRPRPVQSTEANETMLSYFSLTAVAVDKKIKTPKIVEPPALIMPPISIPPIAATSAAVVAKPKGDREIFVARYGKIYKRKAPSPVNSIKLNSPPGFRYCKLCDTHKPLSAFYTAVKRFVCRKCHKDRVLLRVAERIAEDPITGYCLAMWMRLGGLRAWFGYPKLQFDCTTMKDIVCHAQIPWFMKPMPCPIDPALPMRPRNVAFITKNAFYVLMKIWRHTSSRANYIAFVQRCNLVPPKFDVAFPCDAYHDPTYVRPIIDIGPIILEEQSNTLTSVETVDHSNMAALTAGGIPDLDKPPSAEFLDLFKR